MSGGVDVVRGAFGGCSSMPWRLASVLSRSECSEVGMSLLLISARAWRRSLEESPWRVSDPNVSMVGGDVFRCDRTLLMAARLIPVNEPILMVREPSGEAARPISTAGPSSWRICSTSG